MNDVFPHNTENYGIVKLNESGDYDFMIIDHFPGGNGPIRGLTNDDERRSYSPRQNTVELCKKMKNEYKGNLTNMNSSDEDKKSHVSGLFAKEVNHLLFTTEEGRMSIKDAMEKAQEDIDKLADEYPVCFLDDAKNIVKNYIAFINETTEDYYKKTDYFKIYEEKTGGRTQ